MLEHYVRTYVNTDDHQDLIFVCLHSHNRNSILRTQVCKLVHKLCLVNPVSAIYNPVAMTQPGWPPEAIFLIEGLG